jgi:hypothetical protein
MLGSAGNNNGRLSKSPLSTHVISLTAGVQQQQRTRKLKLTIDWHVNLIGTVYYPELLW